MSGAGRLMALLMAAITFGIVGVLVVIAPARMGWVDPPDLVWVVVTFVAVTLGMAILMYQTKRGSKA